MTSDDTARTALSRSLDLLWSPPDPAGRGPRRGLTLDQIVDAAIAVADTAGIDGLSMRKVADELGVGAMTLYRYVPGKAEMLNLMLDRVYAPAGTPTDTSDVSWRHRVEAVATESWDRYLAHPWLLQVNWSRPVLGPNMVADFESGLAGLAETTLSDRERVMVSDVVDGYVAGMARSYLLSRAAPTDTGISDADFWAHQLPALEAAVETGRYPTVAQLDDDAFRTSWSEVFEFGLQRLLDGLEHHVRPTPPV